MNKKYVALFMSAFILGTFTTNLSATATGIKNYDVNGDNQINTLDVMEVKQAVLNGETVPVATTTTYYPSTTTYYSSTTTKLTTTVTTTQWSTVLDDTTKSQTEENYKILAREYIQDKSSTLYDAIEDISVDILRYGGYQVVTTTEPTTTTTTYNDSSNNISSKATTTTTRAVTTTRISSSYDAIAIVTFNRTLDTSEKDVFPQAWVEGRNYIKITFSGGKIYNVT